MTYTLRVSPEPTARLRRSRSVFEGDTETLRVGGACALRLRQSPAEGDPNGRASCLGRETLLQHWSHLL
ncbi:hypothetical protein [Scytonema sp. PCC 10023]|uniref:hypothetical protein n=1 Tax=Scytonema sp. PCC 10023 TaxID=1680591 RepID=UPI0039C5C24C